MLGSNRLKKNFKEKKMIICDGKFKKVGNERKFPCAVWKNMWVVFPPSGSFASAGFIRGVVEL